MCHPEPHPYPQTSRAAKVDLKVNNQTERGGQDTINDLCRDLLENWRRFEPPKPYRPRKRKHKLQPRVDLPPFEPWPVVPRTTSQVIADMKAARRRPRNIELARLVPEDVRKASAVRWRKENEELKLAEQNAADLPPVVSYRDGSVDFNGVLARHPVARMVIVEHRPLPSRLKLFGYWLLGWKMPSDAERLDRAKAEAIERWSAFADAARERDREEHGDYERDDERDVEPPTIARRAGWPQPGEDPKAFAFDPRTAA